MVWILKLWILGRGAARRCVTLHPTPRPPAHIISLGLGFLLETLVRRDGETQDRTDAEPMPRTTQAWNEPSGGRSSKNNRRAMATTGKVTWFCGGKFVCVAKPVQQRKNRRCRGWSWHCVHMTWLPCCSARPEPLRLLGHGLAGPGATWPAAACLATDRATFQGSWVLRSKAFRVWTQEKRGRAGIWAGRNNDCVVVENTGKLEGFAVQRNYGGGCDS